MTHYRFAIQCSHGHKLVDVAELGLDVLELVEPPADADPALTQRELREAYPELPRRKVYLLRGDGVEYLMKRSNRLAPLTMTGGQSIEVGGVREHVDLACPVPGCTVNLRRRAEDLVPKLESLGRHAESDVDLRALRRSLDT